MTTDPADQKPAASPKPALSPASKPVNARRRWLPVGGAVVVVLVIIGAITTANKKDDPAGPRSANCTVSEDAPAIAQKWLSPAGRTPTSWPSGI